VDLAARLSAVAFPRVCVLFVPHPIEAAAKHKSAAIRKVAKAGWAENTRYRLMYTPRMQYKFFHEFFE